MKASNGSGKVALPGIPFEVRWGDEAVSAKLAHPPRRESSKSMFVLKTRASCGATVLLRQRHNRRRGSKRAPAPPPAPPRTPWQPEAPMVRPAAPPRTTPSGNWRRTSRPNVWMPPWTTSPVERCDAAPAGGRLVVAFAGRAAVDRRPDDADECAHGLMRVTYPAAAPPGRRRRRRDRRRGRRARRSSRVRILPTCRPAVGRPFAPMGGWCVRVPAWVAPGAIARRCASVGNPSTARPRLTRTPLIRDSRRLLLVRPSTPSPRLIAGLSRVLAALPFETARLTVRTRKRRPADVSDTPALMDGKKPGTGRSS